ncbi:hypothetical protein BGZ60DRAFT_145841 [Tricladium varicosporioides]|nr:hypothetical protein BGZ60DRAFT_145841 [Hymenoscyphus varicosporioides]
MLTTFPSCLFTKHNQKMAAEEYYNSFSQIVHPSAPQPPGRSPPQYNPWPPSQLPTSTPLVRYNSQDKIPPYPVEPHEQGYQGSPQYRPQNSSPPQPQHHSLQHHHSYPHPQQQPYLQPKLQQTPRQQQGQQEYSDNHLLPPLGCHRSHSEPPPPQHHRRDDGRDRSSSRSRSGHQRKDHSQPRSRPRSHSRSRAPHRKERQHDSRNTFLGALGGGVIGDLIFPGLGTLGGAVLGGIGGHKASRSSSGQPHRKHDRYDEYEEGRRRRGEI